MAGQQTQAPLLLYRNPPTFLFKISRFRLLICDQCFALLSPPRSSLRHCVLVKGCSSTQIDVRNMRTVIHQKLIIRIYKVLYMDFSYKNTSLRFKRPLLTPWSRMDYFFYRWMDAFFLSSEFELPFTTIINLEGLRIFSNKSQIVFV